ncbi:MAG: glycosyl transferase [Micrococcaceae bacterium]|nr:glycosyl transferase [Micrococcaceae bacterium]
MRILLWHVHGGWTDAFVRGGHEYLLPTLPDGGGWGLGRAGRHWPANVLEVHPDNLADESIDVVVLQRTEELAEVERLTGRRPGRDLPAVFLEHNTPKAHVTDTVHPLAGQSAIPLVHVTYFNSVFWDNGKAPVTVIEHGIVDPGPLYTGDRAEMAAVINEPIRRHRVTGTDLLPHFAAAGPVVVYGMKGQGLAQHLGLTDRDLRWGGDLPTRTLHRELARSRVYVHPLRWTSLGLSLLEAMHLGMPVLVLASTEAVRAVPPEAGALSASPAELAETAGQLLRDPQEAAARGAVARSAALRRYGLQRFLSDWDEVLNAVLQDRSPLRSRLVSNERSLL